MRSGGGVANACIDLMLQKDFCRLRSGAVRCVTIEVRAVARFLACFSWNLSHCSAFCRLFNRRYSIKRLAPAESSCWEARGGGEGGQSCQKEIGGRGGVKWDLLAGRQF